MPEFLYGIAARGPGSYTNSGTGLTAILQPTNGGTGFVMFRATYQDGCDTNVQTANPVRGAFTVIQISNLCEATIPANQTRTTIGVGELVDLSLVGPPSGTFTWWASDAGNCASTLSSSSGTAVTFTAPSTANDSPITITVAGPGNTPLCTLQFAILEPQSETTGRPYETNLESYDPDGPPIPSGTEGASMYLIPIYVNPTTVSFAHVQCQEQSCPATSMWGVFTNAGLAPMPYRNSGIDLAN